MFQLEILDLIKKYNSQEYSNKEELLNQIGKLGLENPNQLNQLHLNGALDETDINLIKKSINIYQQNKTNKSNNEDDITKIKNAYVLWSQNFRENNNQTNQQCNKIVEDIVNFYAPNRYEIIEKILIINDTLEFEKFKNHIKNQLRVYFSEKIKEYRNSQNFKNLNFIQEYKKRKEIINLYEDISNYKFDKEKIQKVIKEE